MTKAEKQHLAKLAQLTCALCGTHGVQVHHVRTGQGMAQRAGHFCAIPLCIDCHTGSKGIHGDQTMLKIYRKNEMDLLDETLERLHEQ